MRHKKLTAIFTCCLSLWIGALTAVQSEERRKPVIMEGKTFLPVKVIARPFSNIYKQADENSTIIEENVPVFQSYYVYDKPETSVTSTETKGWYEVGSDNRGTVLGWMKAGDVMEWKQTMVVSYEHPLGRKPILMFDDVAPLREMVKMTGEERQKKAEEYYSTISTGQYPADFPIISVEPEGAVDITKNFYLLPILESAPIEIEGREGRMLKIASAPKSGRGSSKLGEEQSSETAATPEEAPPKADTEPLAESDPKATGEPQVVAEAQPAVEPAATTEAAPPSDLSNLNVESDLDSGIELSEEAMKKVSMDVVYVVDMTNSMQPYIDATVSAIKAGAQKLSSNPELSEKLRFGLWGYRDSTEIPGMEFTSKLFTPELQDIESFVATLEGVTVTPAGSQGYNEDVFSGVTSALTETNWREDTMHIIMLVGDAPSHEPGHKWNASEQSADTLRTLADDSKAYIVAYHIKDPEAEKYWPLAEQQFRTLSTNKGLTGESSYFSVDSNDLAAFESASVKFAESIVKLTSGMGEGKVSAPPAPGATEEEAAAIAYNAGYAALVEWLGSQENVEAPRDITAWVVDKDLLDPSIPSLDVKVLINKKDLDSLKIVLGDILVTGRRGIISGEKFFTGLQAVVSAAGRDGSQIKNAKSLAETGLLPEFMTGLPYASQILSLNDDLWDALSLDQQEELLNEIDAKLKLYVTIHDEPGGWVALSEGVDADEHVYPLSLEALP